MLTVLALILSGLLQPLTVAQGKVCHRMHASTASAQQARGGALDPQRSAAPESAETGRDHRHPTDSAPGGSASEAAPCAVAALPAERRPTQPSLRARSVLPTPDSLLARLLVQSFFRPPRLS